LAETEALKDGAGTDDVTCWLVLPVSNVWRWRIYRAILWVAPVLN